MRLTPERAILFFIACMILYLMSGCSTIERQFENRISCTIDKSQYYVVSLWGPLGIASKIAKSDGEIVCSQVKPASASN